uniref:Uncharacterized protein n=1 Tax=Poecilia latipinna TaxID=48699 RepID=A0A3B3V193_9TELE
MFAHTHIDQLLKQFLSFNEFSFLQSTLHCINELIFLLLFLLFLLIWTSSTRCPLAQHHLSFGLYGAFLSLHLFLQSLFAFLEHRRMRSPARPQHLRRSVALCIAAYQEDPDYLRKCLRSVRRISFPGLKVVN